MSDQIETSTLTLRSPADLLTELPALLGFHPSDSFIAVLSREHMLRCVVRVDLVDLDPEFAIRIVSVAHNAGADQVHAVVYTDRGETESLPHAVEMDHVRELLEEAGVQVMDILLATEARFWSYLCTGSACCPPEGRPLTQGTPVLEATRVRAGRLAIAASRAAAEQAYRLRPGLEPTEDALRTARLLLTRSAPERGRLAVDAVHALVRLAQDGQFGLDWVDDQLDEGFRAALILLIQDIQVRDLLLGTLASTPGSLSGPVEALIRAAVSSPEDLRPAVAATAAALLAAHGDDPVGLWAMLDHAEGQSLATLVQTGVEQGLPPESVRDAFAEALPLVLERVSS